MASSDSNSHVAQLSDSLRQLEAQQATQGDHDNVSESPLAPTVPRTPHSRDDYGFRKSGLSSPHLPPEPNNPTHTRNNHLVPDPNGLGWPGKPIPEILSNKL